MKQELKELFALRWQQRERLLIQDFLKIKQEMFNRGLFHSSITITKYHEAIVEEFDIERKLITQTIVEFSSSRAKLPKRKEMNANAQQMLDDRKLRLENKFVSETSNIMNGSTNSILKSPLGNLNEVYPLAKANLSLELSNALTELQQKLGTTLTDRIKNRFLNNPIIAVGVLVIVGVTVIFGFLELIGFV